MPHTEGPWVFEENEHSGRMEIRMGESVDGASYRVSHKPLELPELYPQDGAQYEEMMANGRLMSVAPDLLAVLARLVDVCTHANKGAFDNGVTGQNGYPDEGDVHAWAVINEAEAALRAARGEVQS